MTLSVRRARRADLPALVALLADDPIGAGREGDDPAPYEVAFDRIAADDAQFLACLIDGDGVDGDGVDGDGQVVGTLQLTVIPGLARGGATRGQIEAVRIRRDRRAAGLDEVLVRWAVAEARRRGCAIVQLTTDRRRADAHRFYARLGFVDSHAGLKLSLA